MKIALLGAESTGKTDLTRCLVDHFGAQTLAAQPNNLSSVYLISEFLREWCNTHGRTPLPQEQKAIALEQARRVNTAPACDWLFADTTPLMTAIYSDLLFNDTSLYDMALTHQRSYDLTLLTGLDLPWVADGLQRDGPHVREPVDTLIRAALQRGKINYQVVYGVGDKRLDNALRCLKSSNTLQDHAMGITTGTSMGISMGISSESAPKLNTWLRTWTCDRCSDPECEHRLFTGLL